jgi:MFS family permease
VRTTLTVLRHRAFGRLWVSYSASAAATGIMPTALTLAILDRADGFTALGLVLGARVLGFVIGALPAGVIADRYPRTVVLAVASAARALGTLAVGALVDLPVVVLCASVFLAGAGEGVFRSAYQALVADLVPEDQRQAANAATTLSLRIWLVGGPGLAVVLYSEFGRVVSLLVAAALWLGSAALAFRVPTTSQIALPAKATAFADFRAGLVEATRHRWFLAGLAALVVWLALGESAKYLMLPVVSRERFGGNALIGIALGAYSVGAVVGALLMARWKPRHPGIPAMILLGSYGLVPLSLAYATQSWTIIACCAIGGFGIEVFNIPWFTAIQREIPPHLQARISSLDFLVSYGMSPVGLAVLPGIIQAFGAVPVLTACGLLVIVSSLLTLLIPGMREFSHPQNRALVTT